MFQGFSDSSFHKYFRNNEDCLAYLFQLKWEKGYSCFKCGCKKKWNGRSAYHVRCKSCGYEESVLAHTLFHGLKIPLLKAFKMVFRIVVSKKGISTLALSREFGVNQKSAWLLKRKVQEAMGFDKPKSKTITSRNIDGVAVRFSPLAFKGLHCVRVLLDNSGHGSERSQVFYYVPKSKRSIHSKCGLINGKFVGEGADIRIWNLRVWITGTHHHCSVRYLQGYLDEFAFRLRNCKRIKEIFHQVLKQLISAKPYNRRAFGDEMDNRTQYSRKFSKSRKR